MKTFELPNGTTFSTDNMKAQSIRLHSCGCKIVYDPTNNKWLCSIIKCKLHSNNDKQKHLDKSFEYAQSFPKNHPNFPNLTKDDWIDIHANMAKERKKIG